MRILSRIGQKKVLGPGPWQEAFLEWNAERLGIDVAESRRRFQASSRALPGGFAGKEFARYVELTHALDTVFFDETPDEIHGLYQHHALLHFLRMLSYDVPAYALDDPIVSAMQLSGETTIVDYGCGLAQRSIALAQFVRRHGAEPRLFLTDIPTLRRDFVLWLCRREELPCEFAECTPERPRPRLPACDVCVATEVFEHVFEPLELFDHIDAALKPGGVLVTNVRNHKVKATHVSPDLGALRARLLERGYTERVPQRVLTKPA